jgi:phosphoglycerol transferase MdoB-like AlkP superfamily enzyme
LLPHAPYRLLLSGHEYGNAETIDGIVDDSYNQWTTSQLFVDQALQRLVLQVGYVDQAIGELTRRLKATGLYDRALVVVAADHGASFRAGGFRRTVSPANLADIASVPLFVKYPGQQTGGEDDRDARTVDIVPTIADVLGVKIPWKGRRPFAPRDPRQRAAYCGLAEGRRRRHRHPRCRSRGRAGHCATGVGAVWDRW